MCNLFSAEKSGSQCSTFVLVKIHLHLKLGKKDRREGKNIGKAWKDGAIPLEENVPKIMFNLV